MLQTANLSWLFEGYVEACARFQAAADSRREGKETFKPLFEALNWAASIEDFVKRSAVPFDDGLVRAFVCARNRVHHHWADALSPVETPVEASLGVFQGPTLTLSGVSVEWFWKPVVELPPLPEKYHDPKGEKAYSDLLAGESVRPTLRDLQAVFETRL